MGTDFTPIWERRVMKQTDAQTPPFRRPDTFLNRPA